MGRRRNIGLMMIPEDISKLKFGLIERGIRGKN